MKKTLIVLIAMVFAVTMAFSQNPPANLTGTFDEETSTVSMTWDAPAIPGEEFEILYDDGVQENGLYYNANGEVGAAMFVRMDPPAGCQILDISCYVYTADGAYLLNDIWFMIYDEGLTEDELGTSLYTGAEFTPVDSDVDGWNVEDVSAEDLNVTGSFWVGVAYTNPADPPDAGPLMGMDGTAPIDPNSYIGSPPYDVLTPLGDVGFNYDFMIRSTVLLDNGVVLTIDNQPVEVSYANLNIMPNRGRTPVPASVTLSNEPSYRTTPIEELDDLVEYIVYRDDVDIAHPADPMYDDVVPGYGNYEWYVTALWDPEGESEATNSLFLNWPDPDNFFWTEDFEDGYDGWTIEDVNGGGGTWVLEEVNDLGWLTPNYMFMDADDEGAGSEDILTSPSVDCSGRSNVILYFDFYFQVYIEEYGHVEVSNDGGITWHNVITIGESIQGTYQLDISEWADGQPDVMVRFHYDDTLENWGWYWGVDNVQFYGDMAGGPLVLTATPVVDPVIVGPGPDSFQWDAFVQNVSGGIYTFDAWTMLTLPPPWGIEFGPLDLFSGITLPDGMALAVSPFQAVPGIAPPGMYTYHARVGDFIGGVIDAEDTFPFEVLGAPGAVGEFTDGAGWVLTEWFDELDELNAPDVSANIPSEYVLHEAYPNPFNPTTSIAISLPEMANLKVTVVNTLGQQVAEVANGHYAQGYYNFTFDARDLASGIYFVQAVVPGKLNDMRKLVLLR